MRDCHILVVYVICLSLCFAVCHLSVPLLCCMSSVCPFALLYVICLSLCSKRSVSIAFSMGATCSAPESKQYKMVPRNHEAHLLTIVLTSHRYTIKHIYTIIITSYRYMEDVERGAELSFPLQSALFLVYAGRCLEWFWRDSRLFSRWIWDVFSRDTTSKDNRRCLLTVILFCFLLCRCCNGLFLVTGSIYRKH